MLHQLGSGVLGPVFRAHDDERDRLVAVKVFRLDLTPEMADDVGDDLQALVRHWPTAMPGLVRPVRAGVDQATPWLAQEFAHGEGLDAVLRRRTRPAVEDVVALIALVADALDAAAADGWTHGALHPRDILVTSSLDGIAITGVGIAHVVERAGFRAPRRRPYVAPERVAGHGWDARADLYSLAVMTLELIGTRRASSGGHLPVATELDEAGLDIELWSRALTRALAEDPAQRFATAREFAEALEAASSSAERAPRLPLEDPEEPEAPEEPELTAGARTDARDEAAVGASPLLVVDTHHDALVEAETSEPDLRPAAGFDDPLGLHDDKELQVRPLPDRRAARFDVDAERDEPAAWDLDEASGGSPVPAPLPLPRAERPYGLLAATLALGVFVGFLAGAWFMRAGAFSTAAAPPPAASAPVERAAVTEDAVVVNDVVPSAAAVEGGTPARDTPSPAPSAPAPSLPPVPVATSSVPVDPTPGVLRITSSPSGARVAVDGRARGTTPLVLRDLKLGTYRLDFSRTGHQDRSTRVSLTEQRVDASVEMSLPRTAPARAAAPAAPGGAQGTVVIATRPAGARVFLDGRPVGSSPVTVPNVAAGSHQVRLELAGHRTWTTVVEVTPNQTRRVSASLEPTGTR